MPKNIFNFTVRYINNTLPTQSNLTKWGISSSSDCSFCLSPETLLHIVAGCKSYLDQGRFTWRHDSVLKFIANSLTAVNGKLYSDLPEYLNPSIIIGDKFRPDLLFILPSNHLYILELTIGYESNLSSNSLRKKTKYKKSWFRNYRIDMTRSILLICRWVHLVQWAIHLRRFSICSWT